MDRDRRMDDTVVLSTRTGCGTVGESREEEEENK